MKKILLPAFLFWASLLLGQQTAKRPFIWGGLVGFDTQILGIELIDPDNPEMYVEAGRAAYGGSVGAFGRWPIWRGLSVQPALCVSTLQSKVKFYPEGTEYYRFTDMELPLHFVLTNPANERSPLRGSLLIGARLGWNFAPQKAENIRLLRERLALDAGLGVEIRLKNWRLQPEFVYSHCLNNIHEVTNAPYDWAVGRVVRDRLTLRVLVWGNK